MKTILSVQSHVAYGYVGNRAATLALQLLGHEVVAINTVQFSNHTGYGDWTGQIFSSDHIQEIIDGLYKRGVLQKLDAVLTGYLGDAALGGIIIETLANLRAEKPGLLYCCDPVMGDVGRGLFVRDTIPDFFKSTAAPQASILTPNQFELALLSDITITTHEDARTACNILHERGTGIILLTSLETRDTQAGTIEMLASHKNGDQWVVTTPKLALDPAPNGAGDLTAAIFLGHILNDRDIAAALSLTADSLHSVFEITKACGQRELALIAAQDAIRHPAPHFTARKL